MDEYFQDYSVRTKNARNSLPFNGYPVRYTAERRGSRDEREKSPQRKEKARPNDENGNTQNTERKLSTGEKIDLDFLRLIANRSAQSSPSNVRIDEDGQEGAGSESGDKTLDLNVGVVYDKPLENNDEGRFEESKKSDNVLITENADTNLITHGLANSYEEVTLTDNDDSPARHDHSMRIVKNDFENTNNELESIGKPSDVEIQHAASNVDSGDDNNTDEVAGEVNATQNECFETKETDGQEGEEKEGEREIVEKPKQQGLLKQEIGGLEDEEKEQQKEDGGHSGELIIPGKEQGHENVKERQEDEQHEQQQQQEAHQGEDETLQHRDKEQIDKKMSENIHSRLSEPAEVKTLENGQENVNIQNNDTPEVSSETVPAPQ